MLCSLDEANLQNNALDLSEQNKMPIELYGEPCYQEGSLLHNCLADLAVPAVISPLSRNGRGVLETGRPE